ncbi:class I SAM-dependent methyltransferase [Halovenus rubra]|uniref:Class I SAM-dependent methyltransferase n=2 Tax=Halovenus rubra TaxID=869890 RepID=A0ABD5XAM1_9EURY|nr:class I SAM-dependent methyltransferase [Halovenus rubra]
MSSDPFGRALRDHYRDEREEPLQQRDGEEVIEHPIEEFYFGEFTADHEWAGWLESRLQGPLLDLGAGVGKHALYFQETLDTVALEVSDDLVAVMDARGVEHTCQGDMFDLQDHFERDQFGSALAFGTQVGLAGSMDGLRTFLSDLAYVTQPGATALVDCIDPKRKGVSELLGYRPDPAPGLAFRVMTFAYAGTTSGILLFRLFSPNRIEEATVGTCWEVNDIRYGDESTSHYVAALSK